MLLTPSFYIWTGWIFLGIIYCLAPINLRPVSLETSFLFAYTIIFSLISNLLVKNKFHKQLQSFRQIPTSAVVISLFVFSYVLGLVGLLAYLQYASSVLGGFDNFIGLILSDPFQIRGIAVDELGFSTQLSYLSWVAIGLGIVIACQLDTTLGCRFVTFGLVIVEVILNLLYIDRTRPIWILFIVFFSYALTKKKPADIIRKWILLLPVFIVAIFVLFSAITGKIYGGSASENLLQYSLGGFAYFDSLRTEPFSGNRIDFLPVRTFYPISKILAEFQIIAIPPSQVLDFRDIPFSTNVGTFLEPLYSDGGDIFVVLGIPLVIISNDLLALYALQRNNALSGLIYANSIFSAMFSFFVPKFCSVPTYVFVLAFIAIYFLSQIRVRHMRR